MGYYFPVDGVAGSFALLSDQIGYFFYSRKFFLKKTVSKAN